MLKLLTHSKRFISRITKFPFSSQKDFENSKASTPIPDLDEEHAILASAIIKQIQHPSPNKRFITHFYDILQVPQNEVIEHSLRQKILMKIQNAPVSQQSKTNISKIFQDGIEVDLNVWSQQNILKTSQFNPSQASKLITFCPNYMVTRKLFTLITKNMIKSSSCLTTGFYGISKTFSFLLFSILSDYIVKYRIKKMSKLSAETISEKILNVPKILYISIQNVKQFPSQMKKIIQMQLKSDLSLYRQKGQKLKQIQQLFGQSGQFNIYKIKQFYKYFGIKVILVSDQINNIATSFRQFIKAQKLHFLIESNNRTLSKEQLDQLKKQELSQISSSTWQQIEQNYYNARKIRQFLIDMLRSFSAVIYLSPFNIQTYLLSRMDLNNNRGHSPIKKFYLGYPQKFISSSHKYQLADFFLFQVCKTLLINHEKYRHFDSSIQDNHLAIKQQLRKNIANKINQDNSIFLTPLLIYQALETNEKQEIKIIENDQEIKNYILQTFQYVCNKSVILLRKKIQEFFFYNNLNLLQTKFLAIKLYLQAVIRTKLINENDPKKQSDFFVTIQQSNLNGSNDKVDRHLFKYDEQRNIYQLMLYPTLLVRVMEPMVNKILKQEAKNKLFLSGLNEFDNSLKGQLLELQLLKIFIKDKNQIFVKKGRIKERFIDFYPKYLPFEPLPAVDSPESLNYQFFDQFKKYLTNWIQQNKQITFKCFITLPRKKISDQFIENYWKNGMSLNQISGQSNVIDFIIFRILPDEKIVEFKAFDVSIGNKIKMDKIQKFIEDYSRLIHSFQTQFFIQKNKFQFNLDYYVLAPHLDENIWEQNDTRLEKLKQQSQNLLKFNKISSKSRVISVQNNKKKLKTPLKQIGFIDLTEQFLFHGPKLEPELSIIRSLKSDKVYY